MNPVASTDDANVRHQALLNNCRTAAVGVAAIAGTASISLTKPAGGPHGRRQRGRDGCRVGVRGRAALMPWPLQTLPDSWRPLRRAYDLAMFGALGNDIVPGRRTAANTTRPAASRCWSTWDTNAPRCWTCCASGGRATCPRWTRKANHDQHHHRRPRSGRAARRAPCALPRVRRDEARRRDAGVTVDEQGWVAHCFRCGFVESERADDRERRVQPPHAQPARELRPRSGCPTMHAPSGERRDPSKASGPRTST